MSKAASPAKAAPAAAAAPSYKPDPKGLSLLQEADKKLSKSGLLGLFSSSNKYEEARDLLQKAAAQFKISKNWQEAGDAFAKSADIAEKQLKEIHEATTDYVNAAKCFKNVSSELALKYYQLAVDLHMENNKFSQAARIWKELAELNEKEMNAEGAMNAYQKAADCFEAEDSKVNASSCLIKVADLAAEQQDYKKAIEIYENVSNASLENTAARWSVKDYLFKALLCQFVMAASTSKQDMDAMDAAIAKYTEMLPSLEGKHTNSRNKADTLEVWRLTVVYYFCFFFPGTRELKLINETVAAFKADDETAFSDRVFEHEEIYKLDKWSINVLFAVHKLLKDGPKNKTGDDDEHNFQ